MEVTIKSYRDNYEDFLHLCHVAGYDVNNPASHNHDIRRYTEPGSLHKQVADGLYYGVSGDYNLVYYDGTLAGGAGYYRYDSQYVLACTRAYVMPEFRKQYVTQNLVAFQLRELQSIGERAPKKMMITFNKYNSRIYRALINRPGLIPELWSTFRPVGLRTINYTEQYCWEREINEKFDAQQSPELVSNQQRV